MTEQAFIPFARPDIGEDEIAAVAHAMRSGWVTTGPETRAEHLELRAHPPVASMQAAQPTPVTLDPALGLRETVERLERQLIEQALRQHEGNWSAAARALRLDRANLNRLAKRLGVQ